MSRYIDKKKSRERQRKAYDYLVNKGIEPHLSAAIVGNLIQESYAHLDSTVENKIGAVGIAQWLGARKNSLKEFAKNSGTHYKDFDTQLEFLYSELMTTGDSWTEKGRSAFFNAKTAEEAAALFVEKFERSGEKPGEPGYDNRLRNAKSVYLQFNDHAIYGKDERGNVVNVDPKTATDEQIALSPKVKAEFYKENFDIISAKSNTPPPADPKPVAEAKEKINEVEEEKKKEAEFIKKIMERGQPVEEVTTTGKEPEARGSIPLPIEELTPDKNEFFQFFLEESFQDGGEVSQKEIEGINKFIERESNLIQQFDPKENLSLLDRTVGKLFMGETYEEAIKIYNDLVKFKNERKDGPMSQEEVDLRTKIRDSKMFGYPDVSGFKDMVKRIKKGEKEPSQARSMVDRNYEEIRKELNSKYYGLPYDEYTIPESKYKPTNSKNTDSKYYDFTPKDRWESLLALKDKYGSFKDLHEAFLEPKRVGSGDLDYVGALSQLSRFKMSSGEDKKGKYVSYYDIWDLAPEVLEQRGININQLNNPFEIYGRIYEDDF